MPLLFKSLLFIFSATLLANNDCDLLPNGNYKIKYTLNSTVLGSKLEINKDNFYQYWDNGDSARGKMEWIGKSYFILNYNNFSKNEDMTEFGKLLIKSFGKTCFELQKRKGDTISFRITYSCNTNITINEGNIIRLN